MTKKNEGTISGGGWFKISYQLLEWVLGINSGHIVRIIPSLDSDTIDIFFRDVDAKAHQDYEGKPISYDMCEMDQYVMHRLSTWNKDYFIKLFRDRIKDTND